MEGQRLMQAASDIFLGWERAEGLDGDEARLLRPAAARLEGLVAAGGAWTRAAWRVYGAMCGADARARARPLGRPDRDRRLPRAGRTCSTARSRASPRPYADQNERDYQALRTRWRAGGSKRRPGSERTRAIGWTCERTATSLRDRSEARAGIGDGDAGRASLGRRERRTPDQARPAGPPPRRRAHLLVGERRAERPASDRRVLLHRLGARRRHPVVPRSRADRDRRTVARPGAGAPRPPRLVLEDLLRPADRLGARSCCSSRSLRAGGNDCS